MTLKLYEDAVEISVTDEGKGIEDIEKARQLCILPGLTWKVRDGIYSHGEFHGQG